MSAFHILVAATVLLVAAPSAHAQDTQQNDGGAAVAAPQRRVAIPRGEAPPRPAPQPAAPRGESPRAEAPPAATAAAAPADDQRRRAEPRGSRPRGDNPPVGVAVPRGSRRSVSPPVTIYRSAPRYRTAPRVYNNFYYSRRAYPYGYGGFGLGYFYYDPYTWYPRSYGTYYGGGYARQPYGYPAGELRLRVSPKYAEVHVDGYYAGTVDDYDGIVQGLTLEEGPYHIELVAPGFETLEFDVRIVPGRKITYRGELKRQP